MGRLPGIDISHYQGDVDFDVLMYKPVRFCIIKATQAAENPKFQRNWAGCKEIGLTRGAYHLIELDKDISSQVYLYLSVVRFEPGDLPAFLDVETSQIDDLDDPALASARILQWLSEVYELTGARPVLYISARGLGKLEGHTDGLDQYGLWIVDYEDPEPGLTQQPKLADPFFHWRFWQWTSDGPGHDYGMESEGLDMDYFNGCRHDFQTFLSQNEPSNPWEVDVAEAQAYNDSRDYERSLIYDIITFVDANPWYEEDIIHKIAFWQYQQAGLTVDGKVGPATLQAMIDAGLGG